jgi:hypothetical protein
MLMQLVYTSRPTFKPLSTAGVKILARYTESLRARYCAGNIQGVLLAGEDWLAVALEGESKHVPHLLQGILADSRHTHIDIIDMRLIAARRFSGWKVIPSALDLADLPRATLLDFIVRQPPASVHLPLVSAGQ